MTNIQIPSIDYTNGQITNCIIKLDSQSFQVRHVDGTYKISKDPTPISDSEPTPPKPKSETVFKSNADVNSRQIANSDSQTSKKKKTNKPKSEPIVRFSDIKTENDEIDKLGESIRTFMTSGK